MSSKSQASDPHSKPLALKPGGAALVLSFFGVAMSAYLTYVHLRLHQDIGYQSGCSISAKVSCDAVALSDYGTLLGLPVALWGLWFYLVVGTIAALGLQGSGRFPRSTSVWLSLAGIFAAGLSVVLGAISAFAIGAVCPVCLGLYAVNFLLLGAGLWAQKASGEGLGTALSHELAAMKRVPGLAVVFAGLPLLILAGVAYAYPKGFTPVKGDLCAIAQSTGGKVTLEVYSDFQCPHCKMADKVFRSLRSSKSLTIVHHQYPLDQECNPLIDRPFHLGACLQALSAVCAGKQGRYDQMSDAIFDGDLRGLPALREAAQQSGLDLNAFDECLRSPSVREGMLAEIKKGVERQITGTPTAYIGDRRYEGGFEWPAFSCFDDGK